ncbi:hypothetical protein I552_9430 [Mycobacterium xenopi 3993]|nr:hypothetical protein I552_9430 [Mycobacterium xenopi 3993]
MNGAVGDATSAPAMPAMTSVLWTVFNIVPFAVRARRSKPTDVGRVPGSGGVGASRRAVSFRHDSGA